ncbi:hypothetical protein M8494_32080 [Serratia ureilytica]
MPEQFRSLEPVIRERIRGRLTPAVKSNVTRFRAIDPSAQSSLILNENPAKTAGRSRQLGGKRRRRNQPDRRAALAGRDVRAGQDLDAISAELM